MNQEQLQTKRYNEYLQFTRDGLANDLGHLAMSTVTLDLFSPSPSSSKEINQMPTASFEHPLELGGLATSNVISLDSIRRSDRRETTHDAILAQEVRLAAA